jgi:hypothetical protein
VAYDPFASTGVSGGHAKMGCEPCGYAAVELLEIAHVAVGMEAPRLPTRLDFLAVPNQPSRAPPGRAMYLVWLYEGLNSPSVARPQP